ncbi:MAG: thioesterase [Acidimicrobiia bacterium]|nr:thioesterase [Acidimicrobiia bacterium]
MTLAPGLTAAVSLTVAVEDLAPAHRSGDVPVLATPRLVALCEEATVAAVATHLGPGKTTVGARVTLEHLAPAATGDEVMAAAVLEEVAGRRLVFAVTARLGELLLARGRIERVVLDRARFAAQTGA